MFNVNSFKKGKHIQSLKLAKEQSDQRLERKRLKIINSLAQSSRNRQQQWLDKISDSDAFAKNFHEGAIPLKHSDLLSFRPRSLDNKAFNNLGYTPEKHRALEMSKTHRDLFLLDNNKYDSKDNNKQPEYRKSDPEKVIQNRLKFSFLNSHQKIANSILNSQRYSLEPASEKLRFNPKFRENNRAKWISNNNFIMGYKDKSIKPLK